MSNKSLKVNIHKKLKEFNLDVDFELKTEFMDEEPLEKLEDQFME